LSVVDHNAIELSAPRISEAEVGDYIALLKPRVMSLVVFTALVGLVIAPVHVHPIIAFTSILCIAVGAGASGALNMALEGDIDALMSRTANRPIPRGRVTRDEAMAFGITLAFFSVMTLGILVNWYAGALLAFTIFFYVVIYTMWLKRWTAQNIVIGGAAGSLPPVVAWVAATGSLSVEPLLLFLIIFFWTPPHFWALALFRSDDYARAGIPMLPVVAGPDATRLQILLYTVVLVAIAVAPWPLGYFDAIYGVTSLLLGGGMMACAIHVYRRRERAESLRNEGASVVFLAVDGKLAGLIAVADPVKESTPDAIRKLREAGIHIIMATGDGLTTAKAVAAKLGLDEVYGEVRPADKLDLVTKLQSKGKRVAMAGDGINDAPALAKADVGIAMGTGTDVAMASGKVTLVKGDLRGIVRARELSEATIANMKQNLGFALVYNALGVPIAAGVLYPFTGLLLSPMIAAVAMSFSSVSVVTNALRLRRS